MNTSNDIYDPANIETKAELTSELRDVTVLPLEMNNYLSFLEFGLHFASKKIKPYPTDVDEFFVSYFFSQKRYYEKCSNFDLQNKRFPIFGNSIFIDIPLSLKYEQIRDQEAIENGGCPLANGYAGDFFSKNKLIAYKKNNIWGVFLDEDLYQLLREQAFVSYKTTIKLSESTYNRRVNLLKEGCKLLKDNEHFDDKQRPNMQSKQLLLLIDTEIKKHLLRFNEEKYLGHHIHLNQNQQTILMLYLLKKSEFKNIKPTDLSRLMESIFGNRSNTYKNIIYEIKRTNLGYKHEGTLGESIDTIINVFKQISKRADNLKKIDDIKKNIFHLQPKLNSVINDRS
jgi:hypothetical protein